MVKAKEAKLVRSPEDLAAEVEKLNLKIAELEARQPDPKTAKYMSEIDTLNKSVNKSRPDKIDVQEFADHKNISLWITSGVNIGKRIGPLHPENAKRTFDLFWKLKMPLSATRPTAEAIKEYKESKEYADALKAHEAKRTIKNKSKKGAALEKIIKEMARMTGQNSEALTKILSPGEVVSTISHKA
jgi:hypothetical protein